MQYKIKIKSSDSEFYLQTLNKDVIQNEMDSFFECFFNDDIDFAARINQIILNNNSYITPEPDTDKTDTEIINEDLVENSPETTFDEKSIDDNDSNQDFILNENTTEKIDNPENEKPDESSAIDTSDLESIKVDEINENCDSTEPILNEQIQDLNIADELIDDEIVSDNNNEDKIEPEKIEPSYELKNNSETNETIDNETDEINTADEIPDIKTEIELKNNNTTFETIDNETDEINTADKISDVKTETEIIENSNNNIEKQNDNVVEIDEQKTDDLNIHTELNIADEIIVLNNESFETQQVQDEKSPQTIIKNEYESIHIASDEIVFKNQKSQDETTDDSQETKYIQPISESNNSFEKNNYIQKNDYKDIATTTYVNQYGNKINSNDLMFEMFTDYQKDCSKYKKIDDAKKREIVDKVLNDIFSKPPVFLNKFKRMNRGNEKMNKKNVNFDFKLFLAGFIITDLPNQCLACAFYIKNVVKESDFTMKTLNSYLYKAVGEIAELSVIAELIGKDYVEVIEKDDMKKYTITSLGEQHFIEKYQQ